MSSGHEEDESPQHKVKLSPFWIGIYEVSWDEFETYAIAEDSTMLDAVTLASPKLNLQWMSRGARWVSQQVEMYVKDIACGDKAFTILWRIRSRHGPKRTPCNRHELDSSENVL